MDLHEDIHRAIEDYADPDEFRRWLNSAIQNSRSVTFLLQKRKARWSDFDAWYGAWQEDSRGNAVLSWGVTARNRVVKEEDLKTFSEARISLYGERLLEVEDVFVVPPHFTVEMIIADVVNDMGSNPVRKSGTVRVQRRWIDDQLPEYELVSALREMYAGVAKVVRTAHRASGVEACPISPFKRACVGAAIEPGLPCLPPGDPMRSLHYDLETKNLRSYDYVRVERRDDPEFAELGAKRYGTPPVFSHEPLKHATARLELSKQFLEADGYSGPMLALFKGEETRYQPISFQADRPRELNVATAIELHGAWQFNGAVFSSEIWLGTLAGRGSLLGLPKEQLLDSNTEFFDEDPAGDRDEALIVVALTADGRSRSLTLPFARTAEGIVYGDLTDESAREAIPVFLRPIWRRWPTKAGW